MLVRQSNVIGSITQESRVFTLLIATYVSPEIFSLEPIFIHLIKPRNGSVITEKHSRSFHVLQRMSRSIGRLL